LCGVLLLSVLFVLIPGSEVEDNLLLNLLNLPAPPPSNPLFEDNRPNREADFFDIEKPPNDDASPEAIFESWKFRGRYPRNLSYSPKSSERSMEIILSEIEKNPEVLTNFINILPDDERTVEFVKRLYDRKAQEREFDRPWRETVKSWLT
jgi:hypothetical protein